MIFAGPTLEGALAAARAAYGPRVKIVRAQRVRRGVRGLLGQVRYDVHARVPRTSGSVLSGTSIAPPPTRSARAEAGSEGPAPGLANALRDLVEAADEREGASVARSAWSCTAEAEVGELLGDVAALGLAARGDLSSGHPVPDVALHGPAASRVASGPGVSRRVPESVTPRAGGAGWRAALVDALDPVGAGEPHAGRVAAFPPAPAPVPSAGWDRAALRSIGVPPAVMRRLPVEDPVDDGGWRRALQEAIAAVVPAPAEPDADHPIVVSGHGLTGAIAVLRAAVEDGAVPGTIAGQGRCRPATPAALVEVLAGWARS